MKEHTKLCQRQLSKVTLHIVWSQPSRKQTVYYKTLVLLVGFSPGLKEGRIGQERDKIKSSMTNICMIIIR